MEAMAGSMRTQDSDQDSEQDAAASDVPAGGAEPIQWVEVATAAGTPNAVIVAGRLQAHGIPTRITQESVGALVIAVSVGILGTSHVWVPEEHAEAAQEILEQEYWDEEE